MGSRTIRTSKTRATLLKALAQGRSVSAACEIAVIGRSAYHHWKREDPQFAADIDQAIEAGTDLLEDIALQRAAESSDTLLIFLLKARRPHLYRETTKIQHTGTITHFYLNGSSVV